MSADLSASGRDPATTCHCPSSDAWRCAVVQGLSSVACHCECHRPAPVLASSPTTPTPQDVADALEALADPVRISWEDVQREDRRPILETTPEPTRAVRLDRLPSELGVDYLPDEEEIRSYCAAFDGTTSRNAIPSPAYRRLAALYAKDVAALSASLRSLRDTAAGICESRAASLRSDGDWSAANEASKCALAIRASTLNPAPSNLDPLPPAGAALTRQFCAQCWLNGAGRFAMVDGRCPSEKCVTHKQEPI